jgi:hypothetical protein
VFTIVIEFFAKSNFRAIFCIEQILQNRKKLSSSSGGTIYSIEKLKHILTKNKKIMKKSSFVKIGAGCIILLLFVIQLFDTDKNISTASSEQAIEKHYQVSAHVQGLLKTSCYDCHSNNTAYPWYNNIQPVKWWLADHVNSGKRHLNFDEFNAYPKEKKLKKINEITETIQSGEMPLDSYTFIHQHAKLSDADKSVIEKWAAEVKKQIE